MSESSGLLLVDDPEAFMAVVNNDNAEDRSRTLHTLDDLVTCEVLRYGIFNNPAALPALTGLYDHVFLGAPVEKRREIYRHTAMIVPQLGGWAAGALTPFMMLDDDIGIVSTATVDYTSLGTLLNDDPMSRPRDVVNMVTKGLPRNRSAIIGGLLALGDPRVCNLVVAFRSTLTEEQVEIVTKCHSGFTAKCTVEFYLDWLEDLAERRDCEGLGLFGQVAAGLHRLASGRRVPYISDGLRPFPVAPDNKEWSGWQTLDPLEYANRIAPRLYELERNEDAPKVMPIVIRAFGLNPKTPPKDVATPA